YIINRMDANKMKKRFLYGGAPALGAAVMLVSGSVYAKCFVNSITKMGTVSGLSIKVQRDVPVGSIIGEQVVGALEGYPVNCVGPSKTYAAMTYGDGITEGNNVYRTNLSGVGVRVTYKPRSYFYTAPPAKIWSFSGESIYSVNSGDLTVQFVKTGPIASGSLLPGSLTRYYAVSDVDNSSADITTLTMGAGNTVTQLACSLNATNIQVPLGDVLATEFTGVGTTLKPKAFNVGLACDANAKINVSLGGAQSVESSDSSILQLTNAGSDGVAKGVGVQLLYNNTPLKLNQLLALKTSAGGQETFPFTAHYYQTAANITAGSANATATLNISYQ
ncbi:fimbrial protein, partial [Serratia odorifera]